MLNHNYKDSKLNLNKIVVHFLLSGIEMKKLRENETSTAKYTLLEKERVLQDFAVHTLALKCCTWKLTVQHLSVSVQHYTSNCCT